MLTAFINATIFTGKEKVSGKALLIEDDVIKGLEEIESIPADAKRVDCND